jgi:hypothetical protein
MCDAASSSVALPSGLASQATNGARVIPVYRARPRRYRTHAFIDERSEFAMRMAIVIASASGGGARLPVA